MWTDFSSSESKIFWIDRFEVVSAKKVKGVKLHIDKCLCFKHLETLRPHFYDCFLFPFSPVYDFCKTKKIIFNRNLKHTATFTIYYFCREKLFRGHSIMLSQNAPNLDPPPPPPHLFVLFQL